MEPLARKLRTVGVGVPPVKTMIAFLQSVLDHDRMGFTTVASIIYDEACAMVDTEELSIPRQVHRDNLEAESASQYYQRSIFLSYMDGVSSSL